MATRCPICKAATEPAHAGGGRLFPFCSDRCKAIDLGRWLDGRYQIPVDGETDADERQGRDFETSDDR